VLMCVGAIFSGGGVGDAKLVGGMKDEAGVCWMEDEGYIDEG
jgi:hypothetical protein